MRKRERQRKKHGSKRNKRFRGKINPKPKRKLIKRERGGKKGDGEGGGGVVVRNSHGKKYFLYGYISTRYDDKSVISPAGYLDEEKPPLESLVESSTLRCPFRKREKYFGGKHE